MRTSIFFGLSLGGHRSAYLDAVPTAHAIRTFRGWPTITGAPRTKPNRITPLAAAHLSVRALKRRFVGGKLALKSASASTLIDDSAEMNRWLPGSLPLCPSPILMEA